MEYTPVELPIKQRETEELIEDLCLALQDVGVRDYRLPQGEDVLADVLRVQRLHGELSRRGADVTRRLELLSDETSWQMLPLLRDCLMYPDVIPYVRERDGIRRVLRCPVCREREISGREGVVWLCDACKAESAALGVRGAMRVKITLDAFTPPELYDQTPLEAVLLRKLVVGRGDWVAALATPIRLSHNGAETSVDQLILEERWIGWRIGRGMRDIPVNISYVVDVRVWADTWFDLRMCERLAEGWVTDITGTATREKEEGRRKSWWRFW